MPAWLVRLNRELMACERCPRLRAHCRRIAREKRRAYREWKYWGKPVPGFGDPEARVLILGLAPGAHGSNRTGRMFTGDSSGNFLYPVLHGAGFASQARATRRGDGLELRGAYITAVARCAPPDNKPTRRELEQCSRFLDRELAGLKKVRVVVALGRIAFDGYLGALRRAGHEVKKNGFQFRHGAEYAMPNGVTLIASYHPSNQNTQTRRLTREMFQAVFERARTVAQGSDLRG